MAVVALITGELLTAPVAAGCTLVAGMFGGGYLGSVVGEELGGKLYDIGAWAFDKVCGWFGR